MAKSKQDRMREKMAARRHAHADDAGEEGGRGLGIQGDAEAPEVPVTRISTPDVEIDRIDFNPDFDYQRQYYDPDLMGELKAEMERVGEKIAPIMVCHQEQGQGRHGRFWLVYGSRRLRAAKELNWTHIRADIRPPMTRLEASIAQFQDNHVRADRTMSEDAIHIARMISEEGETTADVVRALAMESSKVSEMHSLGLVLLNLTPEEQMRLHELDCLGTALRADLAPLAKEDMDHAVRIVRQALEQASRQEEQGTGEGRGRKRKKVNPTVETECDGLVRITRKLKGGNFTLGFSQRKLASIEDWDTERQRYETRFQEFLTYMESQLGQSSS